MVMGLGSKKFDFNKLPDEDSGDDVDIRGDGEGCSSVTCSICLETVLKNGDRAWANLQCDHMFHLDCIGSAFNAKGVMQCPNCRKVEKGDWRNPSSSSSFSPVYNFLDSASAPEEDVLHTAGYSAVGVRWCPYRNAFRLPYYDNGEFPTSSHHNVMGPPSYVIEPATPTASQPNPYAAYPGSVHSSSSSIAGAAGNVSDWNTGSLAPGEVPNTYGFPMDSYYHDWDYYLYPPPPPPQQHFPGYGAYSFIPTHPTPQPDVARNSGANGADVTSPGTPQLMRPFHGQSSSGRAGSSVASGSTTAPLPGLTTRNRERMEALQAYYQQQSSPQAHQPDPPTALGEQEFQLDLWTGGQRGSVIGSTSSSSDQAGGTGYSLFNIWERDPYMQVQQADTVNQVHTETSIWTSPFSGKFESFHQSHGGGGGEGSS